MYASFRVSNLGLSNILSMSGFNLRSRDFFVLETIPVTSYYVDCQYPVGSTSWVSRIPQIEDPHWIQKGRGISFGRIHNFTEDEVTEHIRKVWEARLSQDLWEAESWKIVLVEFQCPDGREHIISVLPEDVDSKLPLGVMERTEITSSSEVI